MGGDEVGPTAHASVAHEGGLEGQEPPVVAAERHLLELAVSGSMAK